MSHHTAFRPTISPPVVSAVVSTCAVTFGEGGWRHGPRRVDWTAGQRCAVRAIRAILPGFDPRVGTPVWPTGWPPRIVGSITYTRGFAFAAVARAERIRSVGIHSERIVPADTARSVAHMVAAPGDSAPVATGDTALARHATILFATKESIYKCLYPLVRAAIEFEDVSVELDGGGEFRAQLRVDIDERWPAGTVLDGRWHVSDGCAHAGVTLPADR